jgi:hypothetical protein
MRIKLFEEYNEATYWEITKDEYDQWCENIHTVDWYKYNIDSITEYELSKVEYFDFELQEDKITLAKDYRDEYLTLKEPIVYSILVYKPILNKDGESEYIQEIRVDKVKDEWYYLQLTISEEDDYHYYKCDQFDGLIDCLKMIKDKHFIR